MDHVIIAEAEFPKNAADMRELFEEYASWLMHYGISWSLQRSAEGQDLTRELTTLPGKYAAPSGRLLLARCNDAAAGCVGLRPREQGICEMKRLYVRPAFRGRNLGLKLAERIVAEGKAIGYSLMRLDTVPKVMPTADTLYRSLGFYQIPCYYGDPKSGVSYYELRL